MKLEDRILAVLRESGTGLTSYGITRELETRWRGIVGTGTLFLALDRLVQGGRLAKTRDGARFLYCLAPARGEG